MLSMFAAWLRGGQVADCNPLAKRLVGATRRVAPTGDHHGRGMVAWKEGRRGCRARWLIGMLAVVLWGAALGQATPPEGIRLPKDGLVCHFEQVITTPSGGKVRSKGRVALAPPARFRWEYETPYRQLYVLDGQGVWHYEPDLAEAEHLPAMEGMDPGVLRLLAGDWEGAQVRVEKKGRRRFALVFLRTGARAELVVDRKGRPKEVVLQGPTGEQNRIRLLHCREGAPDPALFRFQPPPGVEVIQHAR